MLVDKEPDERAEARPVTFAPCLGEKQGLPSHVAQNTSM